MGLDPEFCRSSLTLLMEYYVCLSILYRSFWSFNALKTTFSTLLMLRYDPTFDSPLLQFLSLEEEAAVPTCNLSETIHNKWLQASGNNMVDLYNATLDNYCRATMQSTAFHNFLKGRGGGFGPDQMVLKLRSATCSRDPKKITQAVGELSMDVGLNSRIPQLEGESIFGSAKKKLNLPPSNESDSHRHDRVNYTLPKIGRNMTPGQSRVWTSPSETTGMPSLNIAYTVFGLPVCESACFNPMAWKIERIHRAAKDQYRGHIANKHCTSRIAKYN
jgi:hypothetical protein